MIRHLVVLFCACLLVTTAFAQDDDPIIIVIGGEDPDPLTERIHFDAGITKMRPWQMNNELFGAHRFDQLNTIGFSFGIGDKTSPESEDFLIGVDLSYGFHVFLKNEFRATAANGDLVNYKMKGWEIMTSSIAVNFVKNEHVDFVFGIGMFYGNLKLYSDNLTTNSGDRLYKNPFVAPMVRTELRFNVGMLTLGTRVSYRYDITHDNWQRKDEGLDPLPGYKFREMQFLVFLGLHERA